MMMTVVKVPAQHRYSGIWWLGLEKDVTQQEEVFVFVKTELIFPVIFLSCQSEINLSSDD